MMGTREDGRTRPRWPRALLLCVLLTCALVPHAGARPKTDKVTLENGDHLTCEIKELNRGKLQVSTDDMGTVNIEWNKVHAVESNYHFRVVASGGDVYYGTLSMAADSRVLRVLSPDATASIERDNVVGMVPIASNFISRVDGSLSLGFNFTKASQVAELSFDWSTIYRGERNIIDLTASSVITNKTADDVTTTRADVGTSINHLLGRKKWYSAGAVAYQRNDELGLKNRFILSGGMGINVVSSNSNLLRTSTGLAWNVEESTDSSLTRNSLEAVFSLDYQVFDYDSPKMDITTAIDVYPSLTEAKRYRIEFDARLKREVVSDFFVEARYYTSTDNKSPATGGWESDYGTILALSWSY